MKQLANFTIEVRATDFILRLTDDEGEVVEFSSSAEKIDQVIEAFNDLMAEAEPDED
jgi:hypothetical protein